MTTWLMLLLLGCNGLHTAESAYTGTIEVTEVEVSSILPGRLEAVNVREGDMVHVGDPIFTLDAERFEAERDLRAAGVEMADATKKAATAQVRAVDAQVSLLKRETKRVEELQAAGVGTDQQVSTLSGQLSTVQAQASAAREMVAQADAVGSQAQAGLRLAEVQLSESTVEAAVDGVVLSRNREPGEVVAPGMSVVTLGDVAHPYLRVYVPLEKVEGLKLGDPVKVTIDAHPDQPVDGKIQRIATEAEFTPREILTPDERVKRVFAVDIALPADRGLHPGVPAEAHFEGE